MIDPIKAKPGDVISSILESPSESRNVEFKPSIPWKDINQQHQLQEIIKSILGMSNVKDGGKIILGVPQRSDRTFTVDGMKETDLTTYEQDNIYQAVRAYGNPEPRFEIRNIEFAGKFFIVFGIQEFLYSPVICIKNGSNNGSEPLVRGAMYIRTHKPETKRVDNETETREIINLAIDKEIELWTPRVQKLVIPISKSQSVNISSTKKFADELKDINL